MKWLISILLILAGFGAIAYSYIGALVGFVGDVEQTARSGDDAAAFFQIIDFIMRGEIPQVTAFLYLGMFLIALAIIYLLGLIGGKSNKQD